MATDKLFSVAGISTLNGQVKLRFANDVMRIKVLAKNGHEDIVLIALPEEMTKIQAAKFLAEIEEMQGDVAQQAIAEFLAKHDREPRARAVRAVKTALVELDSADNADENGFDECADRVLGFDEPYANTRYQPA